EVLASKFVSPLYSAVIVFVPTGNALTANVAKGLRRSRAILLLPLSANHMLPSGPVVMPDGRLVGVGMGISVIAPPVVIWPILFPANSPKYKLPSGPAVISRGRLSVVETANSVIVPLIVIWPMLFPVNSVNQRLPSGPAVMPNGPLEAVRPVENSVIVGVVP